MYSASIPRSDVVERSDRILFADVVTGQMNPFGHSDRLLLSSTGAPWGDVLKLEEHRVPPQYETLEYCPSDHCLAMRLGAPGSSEVRIAGERAHHGLVMPGDLNLLSPGVPRWARWEQATEILFMTIAPAFVAEVATPEASVGHLAFTNHFALRDPAITPLMWALRAELQAGCPAGRLYGESLATALTVHLLRRYAGCPPAGGAPRCGLPPALLRRVLDYMHVHLGDEISLRHLAEVVQLSPHHFATLFKQSTGYAPHQYLLRQRVAQARHLLTKTRLPLSEISHRLGFPSQAHFTTMFRKLVGTTPGAYRKGI